MNAHMPVISRTAAIPQPKFPGVTAYPIGETPKRGVPQLVRIHVAPGASIARHTHKVDARMHITGGSAVVDAPGTDGDGMRVGLGDTVFYEANKPHGFRDVGPDGFSFLTENDGIVDEDPDKWDLELAA